MPHHSRRLPIAIAFTVGTVLIAVLGAIAFRGVRLQQEVAADKVLAATRLVREQFVAMAAPIGRDLQLVAQWGRAGLLDMDDPPGLGRQLIPLLDSQPLVAGLLLTDTEGREFYLLRQASGWLVRTAGAFGSGAEVDVSRWEAGGARVETRRAPRAFDPRTRPWFAGALQAPEDAPIHWTAPYRFQTLEQVGVTAALRWADPEVGGLIRVAAMDVRLDDLFRFLAGMEVTPGARVVLIRRDGTFLAPPAQGAAGPADAPAEGLLRSAREAWETHRRETPTAAAFRHEGRSWWAGFEPLAPGRANTWIGILVPEEDLEGNFRRAGLGLILLGVAATAAGALLIFRLLRRPEAAPASATPPAPDPAAALRALIAGGESATLEFKSTLRTNLKTGQADKAIELAWLKSVVAFLNSGGGTLLIGVGDDQTVAGIGPDGFDSADKALLHVKNLVNQHIGAEFSRHVDCRIHLLDGRTVVRIACRPVESPVFLSVGKNEDFYVRSGPSSIRLGMRQMVRYLEQRQGDARRDGA